MEVNRSLQKTINYGVNVDKPLPETAGKKKQELEENLPSNKKVNKEDLLRKVESFNQFLKATNTQLNFRLHEELNEYYVTIVDEQTKEVVKEIPSKKLLDMYASMKETISLFIDKKI
jgi:flagellar protein FlaG